MKAPESGGRDDGAHIQEQGYCMNIFRFALTAALLGTGVAAHATGYNLTTLAPLGATSADAWDVNNVGQVVGSYTSADFSNRRGYVWSGGTFTTLTGPAGALNANALGVSDGGTVVGSYIDTLVPDDTGTLVLGASRGFIYESGSYATVDIAGAESTFLRGISPDGRYVTGYAQFSTGDARGFALDRSTSALTWIGSAAAGAFTIVQGINNLGQVVGDERVLSSGGSISRTSFIYDLGTGVRTDQNLPGFTRTSYRDISDAGLLAGFVTLPGGIQGFTGTPASFQTFAYGTEGNTILEGINNAGWLTGNYVVDASGNSVAILLTPVPEPSVWMLSLAGLGLVGWQLRRRRA